MMEPEAPEVVRVGTHVITLEPAGAFVIRPHGNIEGDHVSAIIDAFEHFVVGRARAYVLIDLADAQGISKEARRVSAMRQLPPQYAGVLLFGGSFQQQLVVKLAAMAAWYLRGRALGKPMPMAVSTEADARAWIEQRRAKP